MGKSIPAVAFCILAMVVGVAAQEPPPGTIVIRPKAPSPANEQDKPGFITIRPHKPDGTPDRRPATPAMPGSSKLIGSTEATKVQPPAEAAKGPEEDGRIVHESWDVLFVRGLKAGYYHVLVREYVKDGKTFLYGMKTQKLTFSRFGQPAELWGEDSTLETPAGEVLTTRMRQGLGREQKLSLVGRTEAGKLIVTIEGVATGKETVPFPAGVLGVASEARLMKDKKPKPGDRFEYLWYEGRVNAVVKFQVEAKAIEDLVIYEGRPPVKALKLEVTMVPVGDYEQNFTSWIDATTFEPLKVEADVPVLGGKAIILRTTKEFATRPSTKLPELNEVQSVPLAAGVPGMHELSSVVYRVTLEGKLTPERAFKADDRQSIAKAAAADVKTFELTVAARRTPAASGEAANPPADYLSDSFFIDWDNDAVKRVAKQVTAQLPVDADTWQRAKAVETWVNRNMKAVEFSQAMATCSATAKNLTGDCTEYAMLCVGLCRAAGVPARTALGLIYAPTRDGKAVFAFHMWFEVFVEGRWLALDATLGKGSVGPGHLKIADASWAGEKSLAPMLPVNSLLGAKPKIEVVRTTP